MAPEIVEVWLYIAVLAIVLYPSSRFYRRLSFIAFVKIVVAVLFVVRTLEPVFGALKVDMNSKLTSAAIMLSRLAPRVGGYVLERQVGILRLKRKFDERVGNDMEVFRRDMRKRFVRHSERSPESVDKGELLADIKRTHSAIRRRHSVGEVVVAVSIGIIAVLLGTVKIFYGLTLLLSAYLVIFPLSMALRGAVLGTLAYQADMVDIDSEQVVQTPQTPTLRFMKGWNRMLLRNEAVIHKLILVSFIQDDFVLGYERGQELMGKVMAKDMELDEALDELVDEELGEDTTEARWFRRFMRRYFGV